MLAASFSSVQFMETSETMLRHYCESHCHMSAILLLLLKYFSRYTKIFSWSSVQTIPAVLRHLPCQIHNILWQLKWQSENLEECYSYKLSSRQLKNNLLSKIGTLLKSWMHWLTLFIIYYFFFEWWLMYHVPLCWIDVVKEKSKSTLWKIQISQQVI